MKYGQIIQTLKSAYERKQEIYKNIESYQLYVYLNMAKVLDFIFLNKYEGEGFFKTMKDFDI